LNVPCTRVRRWKTTVAGWQRVVDSRGNALDCRLVVDEGYLVDEMGYSLSHLDSVGVVAKVEVDTPIVVVEHELNLKVSVL